MTPRVLIIAGSDSGGGAGVQADIKTVTILGGHAMTAITAITAQNTLGVDAVMPVPAEMVAAQIDAVLDDIGADAIKIGMLGSAEIALAVADRLERLSDVPIVFDPVMVASSGAALADPATIDAFGRLMDVATLVTPNLPELAALGGEAAVSAHGCALLVKGGHGEGDTIVDRLVGDASERSWSASRIESRHTHGTGCTLASAIAVGLASGAPLADAVARARDFVRAAIRAAPGFGAGHGPMGHKAAGEGMAMNLNQVTLPAQNYERSVAFYRTLGLVQIVDSPGRYARFECPGGATLSVHVEAGAGPGDALICLESADLDDWAARLQAAGIAFEMLPEDQRWGWREAHLRDPAGNRLCLYRAGENRRYPPWRIE